MNMNSVRHNSDTLPHRCASIRKFLCRTTQLMVLLGSLVWVGGAHGNNGLYDIYQRALVYDAELKAAEHTFEAIRQSVPLARSSLRPQLTLSAAIGVNDVNSDSAPSFRSDILDLTLRQSLYNRPDRLALDQAKLGVMQAEAQLEAQRQSLILRVATAYFDVLRAQADLVFRRSELDAIRRQKEQNERRFEVGLVPITDVKDAQAQFDLAQAQEIAAVNNLSAAEEALIVISGVDPTNLKLLSKDAPLVAPEPADSESWVSIAEEQNLSLIIAKLATQSANEKVRQERAVRYPTLDLVGRARRNQTDLTGNRDTDTGELRLELSVPILTGGRIKASVHQSANEARAASQDLLATRRTAVQRTRNAYRSVIADISRVQALEQALISTQKSLEAQEAGFAEGLLTSLEVLRSLRDTFRAQSDYSSARYDYILNSLNLKQAVGILHESDLQDIDNWLIASE